MAAEVAAVSGSRIATFQERRAACKAKRFSPMSPNMRLRATALSVVYLAVLDLTLHSILCLGDGSLPGLVGPLSQQDAYKAACKHAERLGYAEADSRCVLLEQNCGLSQARAVIYYGRGIDATPGTSLVRVDSLLG